MILSGLTQILESLSGTFSLITLMTIAVVTIHDPAVGGGVLIAFCGIIPAALTLAEHREQMAEKQLQAGK